MRKLALLALLFLLPSCAAMSASNTGDACSEYRKKCDQCLYWHDHDGRNLNQTCKPCDDLHVCENGRGSSKSPCEEKKDECHRVRQLLEDDGYPEKEPSVCVEYYRECK